MTNSNPTECVYLVSQATKDFINKSLDNSFKKIIQGHLKHKPKKTRKAEGPISHLKVYEGIKEY